jgi:RNA polymerase sigma factor (TIGR02999 family)
VATARIASEKPGQTLQATALVHEAYLRLVDGVQARHWNSRRHVFAAAAEAIRWILVEQARRKRTERHAEQLRRGALDGLGLVHEATHEDRLALDEALNRPAAEHPDKAEPAKLRYYAGLSIDDTPEPARITAQPVFREVEWPGRASRPSLPTWVGRR